MIPATDPAWTALARYPLRLPCRLGPLGHGLINRTLLVEEEGGGRHVLQRGNPIFAPEVHLDIHRVTEHLAERGLTTPRLQPTRTGALWVDLGEQGRWRLLSFVPGLTVEQTADPRLLRGAGELVGSFHRATAELGGPFHACRPGVHDTAAHLQRLAAALTAGAAHRLYTAIHPVAEAIRELARELPPLPTGPVRLVHGDLKISNLLFAPDGSGRGVALVDLDTLGPGTLPVELGDAFRSWCNPAGEESLAARFDCALFAAALQGYARGAGDLLTAAEVDALVPGIRTIALELAARFCRDALEERYFGWDPARFPSAADHNLRRAQSLLRLARSIREQLPEATRLARSLRHG